MSSTRTSRIQVVGPSELRNAQRLAKEGQLCLVDTTSKSGWSSGLSPFILGPCPLYGGSVALRMENAWQFAKVYADQLDDDGEPGSAYWEWSKRGWADPTPHRYPRGKGAKPEYCYWEGQHLDYIPARKQVYFNLYRDAVCGTSAFAELRREYEAGRALALFDFDGYNHEHRGLSLAEVIQNDKRPMGHAFVLKAMLLYGPQVSADDVIAEEAKGVRVLPIQTELF